MQSELDAMTMNVNVLESALAVGYPLPRGLIVPKILPPYPDRSSGIHKIWAPTWPNREHRRLVETRHAFETEPNEVRWKPSYQEFELQRHALRVPMDPDVMRAASAAGIAAAERSRRQCWSQVELRAESDGATLLQTAGTYASGFSAATAAGDEWNGGANDPDPVAVIRSRMETVRQATGIEPNFVAMGKPAWDAFANNANVIERMRGGQGADNTNRPIVYLRDAAAWFAIDLDGSVVPELYVGMSSYWDEDTQTEVDLWADNFIVGINTKEPMTEPLPYFGMTLQENMGEVDGIPITGVFGSYVTHPWKINEFYTTWYSHNIALNSAAFLQTNVVQ